MYSLDRLPYDIVKIIDSYCPKSQLGKVNKGFFSFFHERITICTPTNLIPLMNRVRVVELSELKKVLSIPHYTQITELNIPSYSKLVPELQLPYLKKLSISSYYTTNSLSHLKNKFPTLTDLIIKRWVFSAGGNRFDWIKESIGGLKSMTIENVNPQLFEELCKHTYLERLSITIDTAISRYNLSEIKISNFTLSSPSKLLNLSFLKSRQDSELTRYQCLYIDAIGRKLPILDYLTIIENCPDLVDRMIKLKFPFINPFLWSHAEIRQKKDALKYCTDFDFASRGSIYELSKLWYNLRAEFINILLDTINSPLILYKVFVIIIALKVDVMEYLGHEKIKPHISLFSTLADQDLLLNLNKELLNSLINHHFEHRTSLFDASLAIGMHDLFTQLPLIEFRHFLITIENKRYYAFGFLLDKVTIIPTDTDGAGNNLYHLVVKHPLYLTLLLKKDPSNTLLTQRNLLNETPFETAKRYGYKESIKQLI